MHSAIPACAGMTEWVWGVELESGRLGFESRSLTGRLRKAGSD